MSKYDVFIHLCFDFPRKAIGSQAALFARITVLLHVVCSTVSYSTVWLFCIDTTVVLLLAQLCCAALVFSAAKLLNIA